MSHTMFSKLSELIHNVDTVKVSVLPIARYLVSCGADSVSLPKRGRSNITGCAIYADS